MPPDQTPALPGPPEVAGRVHRLDHPGRMTTMSMITGRPAPPPSLLERAGGLLVAVLFCPACLTLRAGRPHLRGRLEGTCGRTRWHRAA